MFFVGGDLFKDLYLEYKVFLSSKNSNHIKHALCASSLDSLVEILSITLSI